MPVEPREFSYSRHHLYCAVEIVVALEVQRNVREGVMASVRR